MDGTRQVVHGDADQPGQGTLPGVLAQIDSRDHTERGDKDRHQDHHQDGAEDGREDAALRVGLTRLVADELPDLGEVKTDFLPRAHRIRPVGSYDFR